MNTLDSKSPTTPISKKKPKTLTFLKDFKKDLKNFTLLLIKKHLMYSLKPTWTGFFMKLKSKLTLLHRYSKIHSELWIRIYYLKSTNPFKAHYLTSKMLPKKSNSLFLSNMITLPKLAKPAPNTQNIFKIPIKLLTKSKKIFP